MCKSSQAQFYTYYVKTLGREPVMCVSQTLHAQLWEALDSEEKHVTDQHKY